MRRRPRLFRRARGRSNPGNWNKVKERRFESVALVGNARAVVFDRSLAKHRESLAKHRELGVRLVEPMAKLLGHRTGDLIAKMPNSRTKTNPDPESGSVNGEFVQNLIDAQPRLFAYAVSLMADVDAANDVLQESNRVLLEKWTRFDSSQDFLKWACGFVRVQVREHYRDDSRDKLRFSMDLMEVVADEEERDSHFSRYRGVMQTCLDALTPHQRNLIDMRYASGASVARMSNELDRPAASISTSLNKIRRILTDCTDRVMKTEGTL